jgi:DNA-binding beta-propeller fold protein YncE
LRLDVHSRLDGALGRFGFGLAGRRGPTAARAEDNGNAVIAGQGRKDSVMRSAKRRRLGWCLLLTAVSAVAACTSSPAQSQHPASARASGVPRVPGCSTQVTAGPALAASQPTQVSVPGDPTGVAASPDGRWAFAALSQGPDGGEPRIAVLSVNKTHGRLTLVRLVTLPGPLAAAWGMTVSPDGRLLLVAGGSGAAVLSLPRLESGAAHPLLGVLHANGAGAFEAAVSADDHYAFVTAEDTGDLYVFNLALALQGGFGAAGVAVGVVPLATGAVGIAISPDGTLIYVTTYGQAGPYGRLWVINAVRAERAAGARAIVASTAAGCQPVRVVLSDDGRYAWVSTIQSNAVLAFDTATLRQHPSAALRAVVQVGSEPVGLAVVNGGRTVLVTDSDRGLVAPSSGQTGVSVISTAAALAGRPALVGLLPAGQFPRELSYDAADGSVLMSDFASARVQMFGIPSAAQP